MKTAPGLVIKPCPQNAWSLSYNEESEQTTLAYIVDIKNEIGTTAPQEVRVDVYDPDMTLVDSVTNQTVGHTTSADGHTFTYYLNGPVTLATAGDYHFVVEAQAAADDPDAGTEDKDADKWAVEQNSLAQLPTYTLFGGYEPAITVSNGAFSGTANNSPASSNWYDSVNYSGTRLEQAGYRTALPQRTPPLWWAQTYVGKQNSGGLTWKDMIGHPTSDFQGVSSAAAATMTHDQTMQYTAVWGAYGHGFNGDIMGHWADTESEGINRSGQSEGPDDQRWSYLVPNAAIKQRYVNTGRIGANQIYTLNDLPHAWNTSGRWNRYPLQYVRLAAFLACETASQTTPDFPKTAVAMGAKSAVGILGPVGVSDLHGWSIDFFGSLRVENPVAVAADAARYGPNRLLPRNVNSYVAGNQNTTLTDRNFFTTPLTPVQNPRWGDNAGP